MEPGAFSPYLTLFIFITGIGTHQFCGTIGYMAGRQWSICFAKHTIDHLIFYKQLANLSEWHLRNVQETHFKFFYQ